MTKIYRGSHTGSSGAGPVSVFTVDDTGDETFAGVLRHHVRHSPTGFSWGYAGSGPAELARCLLIDALGPAAVCDICDGSGRLHDESGEYRCWDCDGNGISRRVQAHYQSFKRAFVAHWGEDWTMSDTQILDWIASRQPHGGI